MMGFERGSMESDVQVGIDAPLPESTEPAPSANMANTDGALSSVKALAEHIEEYTIVQPVSRKIVQKNTALPDDEPLIDTTAPLAKNSKKTKRLQKQQQKRQKKVSSKVHNFLELPPELLEEVLGYLLPSEVLGLLRLNRNTRDFILQNERSIARDILDRKYWILQQSLPLPKPLEEVDETSQSVLRNPRREKMTEIHKKPYQHIKPPDAEQLCTCPTCILAWNNLNLVLDFAHFQRNLNHREPIPMIPRGTHPEWNTMLIETHARIVERAIADPLCYAAILEKHLNTIVGGLLRQVRFPPHAPKHRHNKAPPPKTVHPIRLYNITERDAASQDDSFLARDGKPSYEFPFHRDNYYSLLAYVPNRKWSKEEQRWKYYAAGGHERDMEWIRRWFLPKVEGEPSQGIASTRSAVVVAESGVGATKEQCEGKR